VKESELSTKLLRRDKKESFKLKEKKKSRPQKVRRLKGGNKDTVLGSREPQSSEKGKNS